MLRFTIRDLFWLTTVVCLAVGWLVLWRTIPHEAKLSGTIRVDGSPLVSGRVCLHAADGQIIGAQVVKGEFRILRTPVGSYLVTIDGEGVPKKYSDSELKMSVEIKSGTNKIDFDLR